MLVCFGETMLRLSPPDRLRIPQTTSFDATYGGAESNVGAAYCMLGGKCRFVTKFPAGAIGEAALWSMRQYGLDCSMIRRGGDRLGVYYLEKGASVRPSAVLYDRAHSAFAESSRADYDWDAILTGADRFFFTGITPAVLDPQILFDALRECRRRGIRVYCDLNYRPKLWQPERAGAVMAQALSYVDVCVANEEHAGLLFGITSDAETEPERLRGIARTMTDRFAIDAVLLTMRESLSSDDNEVAAALYKRGELHLSKRYRVHIVDRVGGGDALTAAYLYTESTEIADRVVTDEDPAAQIDFACAANAIKHSIEGDVCIAAPEEIAAVTKGNVRMKR